MNRIIIEAEEQEELSQAVFIAMGRSGFSRKLPGYTISVNGTVEAVRDSIDDAEQFADYYKDRVLEGNATIILR